MDSDKALHTFLSQFFQDNASISKIVVGVSGGADSLALLHVLHYLRKTWAFSLHVATLDHGLRGQSGADDADFVVDLAREWGLSFTRGTADVYGALYDGESLEAAARRVRYAFLAQVARQQNATYIAVGHHADDQVETLLLHLIRGSGLRGLVGMAMKAPLLHHPDLILLRPFLPFTRQQIEAYCHQHGLQPRDDQTNYQMNYPRNVIRRRILPLLRDLNPQIYSALGHLSAIAATEIDYIDKQAQQHIVPYWSEEGKRIRFPRLLFDNLHLALKRRLVQMAVTFLSGSLMDVSFAQVQAAIACAESGRVGKWSPLGGGLRLRVDYKHIVFEFINQPDWPDDFLALDSHEEIVVNPHGITPIPNANWRLNIIYHAPQSYLARVALPADARLSLRTWRAGDRFAPLGMGGQRRKLQDWFVDRKIPQHQRAYIPLLCADDRVIVILHGTSSWAISEEARVLPNSSSIAYLQILR